MYYGTGVCTILFILGLLGQCSPIYPFVEASGTLGAAPRNYLENPVIFDDVATLCQVLMYRVNFRSFEQFVNVLFFVDGVLKK